jgi:cell division septation protein DedD
MVEDIVKEPFIAEENAIVKDAFYIQMAAYKTTPAEPLIEQLQERGFDLAFIYPDNNLQKVLVGPFVTILEAKEVIGRLKAIKKDAFITKIK